MSTEIEPTENQEIDPIEDYEDIPPSLLVGVGAVYCCKCLDGDVTMCADEGTLGHATSSATAQLLAFWIG